MFAVNLLILLAGIGTSMATADDCPEMQFWNGTQCASCSTCPRGFGVKTSCSSKADTECQPCWPGYDYSNTTGYERCIKCDQYSNCLPGNPKYVKNCTIFSPPVCSGCADGYYLNPDYVDRGRCIKCSPPCGIKQEETRPCSTKHDRKCTAKSATEPTSTPSTTGTSTDGPVPSDGFEGGTEETGPEFRESQREETPLDKRPWFWVVSVAVVAIVSPALVLMVVICRRRQKRTRKNVPEIPMNPLLPRGLDRPVKYLKIDEKKWLARTLNDKDDYGYFYWRIVAEKLGLGAEWRAWVGAENPTDKLLTAYGEMEGSTIRSLIKALREAGLTLSANEFEKLVQDEDADAERIE